MFEKNKKQDFTVGRPIDNLVDEVTPKWRKTFVYMKKTQIKTWQGVIILAFITGVAAASIWISRFDAGIFSEAVGSTATLSLTSGGGNTAAVAVGTDFTVNVMLNTNSSNVVAVNAVVQYNPTNFQLVGAPNIGASIFNNAGDNVCVSQAQAQGKQCNIINTATVGKISVILAKPTTGVNTAAGQVFAVTFKALRAVAANAADIKISFVAPGDYTDSDVILDDGLGTDILQGVSPLTITVNAPTCSTFTYSAWGTCQPDGSQTRTIAASTPTGCTGGSPTLTQLCVYVPPTCSTFTYSTWGTCQPDGLQTRAIATSAPSGCIGGVPALTQSCTYVPPTCSSFTYSAWGACQPDGSQARTIAESAPLGCGGGSPVLTQSCTYVGGPETCTSFTYSPWDVCQANGTQSRTAATSSPTGCGGGAPVLTGNCSYTSPICSTFTYSPWGVCQPDGRQTRIIATSAPSGCINGGPTLTQSCSYTPPTCSTFNYSSWGVCQLDEKQTRNIISSVPSGCAGGNPALTQSCTYTSPTCSAFTYSSWGACQPNGTQARNIETNIPFGCSGGVSSTTQSCNYIAPTTPVVAPVVTLANPAAVTSATAKVSSSKSHHKKETKKKKKAIRVINSPSTVKRGAVLVQHGAYFTKKSKVLVYFGNGRGGYLPPKTVYTNASGKFSIAYRTNKLPGKYSWYAVAVNTGKKSNVATYTVK